MKKSIMFWRGLGILIILSLNIFSIIYWKDSKFYKNSGGLTTIDTITGLTTAVDLVLAVFFLIFICINITIAIEMFNDWLDNL